MGLFKKSKKKEEEPENGSYSEEIEKDSSFDEEDQDILNLGWYWSENKEEFQLAKIAAADRATHFYVIGATGTGKTKFLEYLIKQDIEKGNGFGVIDPHGDLVEDIKGFLILHYSPTDEEISDRVVLIDPTDPNFTVTFNPLEKIPGISPAEQANELISAFRKIWSDSWGVRMEDLMRNSLIALAEAELTLTELPQFLSNRAARRAILEKVSNLLAREYFQRFDSLTDRAQVTWVEPITNKINAFFSDERIRHIFSSEKSSFDIREIMDEKKILLIKLDKGRLKDTADLLGSLLMAKTQMAAFSRSYVPPGKRTPFYLYIDEFQNFASESFSVVLSEARKYGLSLIMAHQTLTQIPEALRSLILGNTGIQVYFRLNRHDASLLAKEAFEYSGFEVKTISKTHPIFWSLGEEWEKYTSELQTLPPRVCYVKHKIEGGIIPIRTVDIESGQKILADAAEMSEERYLDWIRTVPFGHKYLIERGELIEQMERRQKLVEEKIKAKPEEEKKPERRIPPPKQAVPPEKREEKAVPEDKGELSPEETSFLDYISRHPGMFITKIYKALGLSGYKGDRLKESLIERGLIVQEETRKGLLGRLAKVLAVTDKGASILKKSPLEGKGGDLHKHLQLMLKEQAELYGWKAVVEERIPRTLESVDVGLARDDVKAAIEISATSKPEQEIQNIRKCLEAGYDYVISVCRDEKQLALIKKEAKKSFSHKERERIRFYPPSKAKDFLSSGLSLGIVSEKGIVSGQISREKQLLDTKEAAEFLGISKNTLYEWIVQKKIPHIKVGRLVKFKREDLESWLKRRTQEEEKDFV